VEMIQKASADPCVYHKRSRCLLTGRRYDSGRSKADCGNCLMAVIVFS